MRAPYNVLVYPYRLENGAPHYLIMKRADQGFWQGVSGGGQVNERPEEAARREIQEETGLEIQADLLKLDTVIPVPVTAFNVGSIWPDDLYVIPQYSYGAPAPGRQVRLSREHSEFRWMEYKEANEKVAYDGSKLALWELNQRLRGLGPRELA